MTKEGICPVCNRGPRKLREGPGGKGINCFSCYVAALKKMKVGPCPVCGREKPLIYGNPDDKKQKICHACYTRIKRYRASGIARSLPLPKVKKEKVGRIIKYPTKESVEEEIRKRFEIGEENNATILNKVNAALYRAARRFGVVLPKKEVPESTKSGGRRGKYSTEELAMAALEDRAEAGRGNYSSILRTEDLALLRAVRRFGIILPRKGRRKPVRAAKKHTVTSPPRPAAEVKLEARKQREKEKPAMEKLAEFFLGYLKDSEVDYLTESLAVSLCREKFGQNNHSPAFIRRSLDLLSAAPEEVMVDKISNPWRYLVREKMEEMITRTRAELLGEGVKIIYKSGQLVENINPRDPSIYGRIGKVVSAGSKEVKIDFKEKMIIRVYKGSSLLNIVPYSGEATSVRRPEKERALSY